MSEAPRLGLEELERFCRDVLARAGLSEKDANTTADALITADRLGVFTHGTKLLPGYLKKLIGGGYRAAGVPRIESEGPAWAIVDGDSALGQVACSMAVETAVHKAAQSGVAYVGVRNTGHIGAAGYYASVAARQGCIAMITGNDVPSVAAPGSRVAVLGSNPLAYGIPVLGADPILLDMATAAVAGGKVYAAVQRGETIPENWLIGPDGLPTSDGSLYPQSASLAPMAGFKGYGLGLWCEILSAVIPGGAVMGQVGSWIFDEPSRGSWHNASILAIDIAAMGATQRFNRRLREVIDGIHAAPTAVGADRVRLPGEREWELYRRTQTDGIALPADVLDKLSQAAALVGVSPLRPKSAA